MRMNTRHSGLGSKANPCSRTFFSGCCAAPWANGLIWRRVTSTGDSPAASLFRRNFISRSALIPPSAKPRRAVQPAPGNEGTALGAAWYVRHHIQGTPRHAPASQLAWGPGYSSQEIKQVLENCKARYRFHVSEEQILEETVQLLATGKIVGWFRGAAEFGPRALGNRSLLASPWASYVKENLNEYVKRRQAFRPFAISVPSEHAAEFFDYTPSARFMATLGFAKPEAARLLEGFLLPGNRVRLHVVEQAANSALWRLLNRFGEFAPAPMLVNTSFNLFGEPLVVAPRDAVRSYFCSGIDALVIGNFSLAKS